MVNYYEKLDIDKNLTTDEINKKLVELDVIWTKRSNINLEKARPMLLLISEAQVEFRTEASRRKYDESLGLYKKEPVKSDIPKSGYVPSVNHGGNSGSKIGSQSSGTNGKSKNSSPPIPVTSNTSSSDNGCLIWAVIIFVMIFGVPLYYTITDNFETHQDTNNNTNNQNTVVEDTSEYNTFTPSDISIEKFNGQGEDASVLKLDGIINQEYQYQTFGITTGSASMNRVELLGPNDFSVNVTVYDSNYNVVPSVYSDSNMGSSILTNGDGFNIELKGDTDYTIRVDQNHNLANYSILLKKSKVYGSVSKYNVIKDKFDFGYQRNEYTYSPLYSGEYTFYFAEKNFNSSVMASIYNENGSLIGEALCIGVGDGVTANLENGKTYTLKFGLETGSSYGNYTINVGAPFDRGYLGSGNNLIEDKMVINKQKNIYSFSCYDSGKYEFEFAEGLRPSILLSMRVCDENGTVIGESKYNSKLEVNLETGKRYKLEVYDSNGSIYDIINEPIPYKIKMNRPK
ncbi:MAG: hypothetical protein K6D97_02355 [Clostridia bacterium]|nr:hypothetical protein [Clostridia bacterium]